MTAKTVAHTAKYAGLALPLEMDWLQNEGGRGDFRSPCIRDANGKVVLDTLNSDCACLEESHDSDEYNDWHDVWDETGRKHAAFIVQACNAWDDIDALRARIVELEAMS